MKNILKFFVVLVGILPTMLCAQVTWQFNFTDSGVGFDDPVHGAARRQALQDVGSDLSDYFSNYTANIQIEVNGSITGPTSTLASAGSPYTTATPSAPYVLESTVKHKILGNPDPDPGSPDAFMEWNFDTIDWELGTDFQTGEYDFYSTAMHEMLHAVGFLSSIQQDGSDFVGIPPDLGIPGNWTAFDLWVGDSNGYLINEFGELDGTAWDAASTGGSGPAGLHFYGPEAMAANGGNPVYLYSPDPWREGSSLSHLDDNFYNGTYLMEAGTGPGLGIREISGLELAMLRDVGFTMVIPEPGTLLLAGLLLGACGFGLRGRFRSIGSQ